MAEVTSLVISPHWKAPNDGITMRKGRLVAAGGFTGVPCRKADNWSITLVVEGPFESAVFISTNESVPFCVAFATIDSGILCVRSIVWQNCSESLHDGDK